MKMLLFEQTYFDALGVKTLVIYNKSSFKLHCRSFYVFGRSVGQMVYLSKKLSNKSFREY